MEEIYHGGEIYYNVSKGILYDNKSLCYSEGSSNVSSDGDSEKFIGRFGACFSEGFSNVSCKDNRFLDLPSFDAMAPLRVYFDPTYRCNLQCRHCMTRSSPFVDIKKEISFERTESLFLELKQIGVFEVVITEGEPFCHPQILKILQSLKKLHLNTGIATNGTLISPEVAGELAQLKLLEIRVSFEGPEKINDYIRGKGTYYRALEGLKNLIHAGIPAMARLTLTSLSENRLEPLFLDLAAAGVKKLKATVIKNTGNASLPENKALLGYVPSFEKAKHLQELGKRYGISVELSSDDFNLKIEETKDRKLRYCKNGCGAGFETAYISPNGNVLPCSAMPYVLFGTINSGPFLDVWKGENATKYRALASRVGESKFCESKIIKSVALKTFSVPNFPYPKP